MIPTTVLFSLSATIKTPTLSRHIRVAAWAREACSSTNMVLVTGLVESLDASMSEALVAKIESTNCGSKDCISTPDFSRCNVFFVGSGLTPRSAAAGDTVEVRRGMLHRAASLKVLLLQNIGRVGF